MRNNHVTISQFTATVYAIEFNLDSRTSGKMRKSDVARDANFSFPDINRFTYIKCIA